VDGAVWNADRRGRTNGRTSRSHVARAVPDAAPL